VVVALALLLYVAYQEYALMTVKSQIAEVEGQIERDEKLSRQAVTLFKQFQAEEKKVQDLETFLRAPTRVSDLMLEMAGPSRIASRCGASRIGTTAWWSGAWCAARATGPAARSVPTSTSCAAIAFSPPCSAAFHRPLSRVIRKRTDDVRVVRLSSRKPTRQMSLKTQDLVAAVEVPVIFASVALTVGLTLSIVYRQDELPAANALLEERTKVGNHPPQRRELRPVGGTAAGAGERQRRRRRAPDRTGGTRGRPAVLPD
jgi:hypothetical protein